jgi:transketolase
MVAEAMRAAYVLKAEHKQEVRVINMHTVKPLDRAAVKAAVKDVGLILTVEEHQTGGFGSIVAAAACEEKKFDEPLKIDMLGVDDRFGQSAPSWQLLRKFGLTAAHIAERALALALAKESQTAKQTKPRIRS